MKRVINHISQWTALTLLVHERWQKKPKPFVVTLTAAPKSHKQLGLLHASVLPGLAQALFDAGEVRYNSESAAKYWLKRFIGYGSWYQFGGDEVVFDADSFQRATIETLNQAIDAGVEQAALRGINLKLPEDNEKSSN